MMWSDKFVRWYNDEFRYDMLYRIMLDITEGSPWHREHNVGVHTNMVVMSYLCNKAADNWTKAELLGALACAFHDTGKPTARVWKFKEERGDYQAFNGHEQISARLWENWAVDNWSMLRDIFDLDPIDIYRVGIMIEHHIPWALRKKDKLEALTLTMMRFGLEGAFTNFVMADTYGRISDDQDEKREKSQEWCDEFDHRCLALSAHPLATDMEREYHKGPTLYVPIGASGSGKTTWLADINAYSDDPLGFFSLDHMRTTLYEGDYATAWQKAVKDKTFRSQCNERYRELLRENHQLYLDATNTTKKARRFHLTEARNRKYRLEAYLFPVTLQVVLDRQASRADKTVPEQAVIQQYERIQLPQIGEFDSITVIADNLPK